MLPAGYFGCWFDILAELTDPERRTKIKSKIEKNDESNYVDNYDIGKKILTFRVSSGLRAVRTEETF